MQTTPNAGPTATTVFATPPFTFPGGAAWQPTPVPTRAAVAAQSTPAAGGSTASMPAAQVASEIWDFPSGRYTRAGSRVYYAAGGDVYESNLYERPFTEQTQDTFFPDLDIRYARLMRAGDWFFATLRLHGLPQGSTAPAGDYGVELDVDLDGRGEYLVWAKGPVPAAWSPTGVVVYQDARPDVEGPRVCTSDAPLQGDGYEQVRYTADATTGLAWLMWAWETEGGQRYPAVYIAFHRSLLDGHDQRMLWQAWADGGRRAPGQMTYHDRFTRPQAGSPYQGDRDFPIREIARVDNTCRAAFGFQPTGLEPCLCETTSTVALCPAPETPPAPGCVPDGPNTWSCPYQASTGGSGVTAAPQGQNFYCVWDPELCQWSCRPERICLPFDDATAAGRLVPILPFDQPKPGSTDDSLRIECYQTAFGCGPISLPGATLPDPPTPPAGPVLPDPPTPPVGPVLPEPPTPPVGDGFISGAVPGTVSVDLNPGDLRVNRSGTPQVCRWNENLCRWQCTEGGGDDGTFQCLQPDPGPNCQAQADGSYLCTTGEGELSLTQVCTWNAETCRWDCRPPQQCPAPTEGPAANCQPNGANAWVCASEIGSQVCTWDTTACRWDCTIDTCSIPDQSCTLQDEIWVCPGKGEFGGCEWSVEKCRWVCWNPVRPKPQPGDEGDTGGGDTRECQPADYCGFDGIWYCQDGNFYDTCEYDGCVWICE